MRHWKALNRHFRNDMSFFPQVNIEVTETVIVVQISKDARIFFRKRTVISGTMIDRSIGVGVGEPSMGVETGAEDHAPIFGQK